MDLVFQDIDVSIEGKSILKDISGVAKYGGMLAIMGPSGAGKSTLMNALAGRIPISGGSITLNNKVLDKQLGRKMRFVLQDDLFFPTLTLMETITFTAMLTLPEKMSIENKPQRVEDTIQLLELDDCKHTMMGNQYTPGLSGGERKRAAIACEIIADPEVLLVDEPTSGLDYSIASNLIKTLKRYSQMRSKTVIASIHQPSSQMFHMFTNVLLISGGQTIYFGPCSQILDHYQRVDLVCDPQYNPADFIMEKLRASVQNEKLLIQEWNNRRNALTQTICALQKSAANVITNSSLEESSVTQEQRVRIENSNEEVESEDALQTIQMLSMMNGDKSNLRTRNRNVGKHRDLQQKWQTGYWTQYRVLTRRLFIYNKHQIYSRIRMLHLTIVATISAILWFQLGRTEKTIGDRNAFLFFTIIHWTFHTLNGTLGTFEEERHVIQRERAAGLYRLSAYWMAKQTSELPLTITMPIIHAFICYFAIGLTLNIWVFIGHVAQILNFVLVIQALAMLFGVLIVDINVRMASGDATLVLLMLVGGFFHQNLPQYTSWVSYVSPVAHAYNGLLLLEYRYGYNLSCLSNSSTSFKVCLGDSIDEITGEDVLETLDVHITLWINYAVILTMSMLFRFLSYLVLRYWRKPTMYR